MRHLISILLIIICLFQNLSGQTKLQTELSQIFGQTLTNASITESIQYAEHVKARLIIDSSFMPFTRAYFISADYMPGGKKVLSSNNLVLNFSDTIFVGGKYYTDIFTITSRRRYNMWRYSAVKRKYQKLLVKFRKFYRHSSRKNETGWANCLFDWEEFYFNDKSEVPDLVIKYHFGSTIGLSITVSLIKKKIDFNCTQQGACSYAGLME